MSSYEEMVVDRAVDVAWTTFRTRLADWLDGESALAGVGICPDPSDPHAPTVEVVRFDEELGVFVRWGEHLSSVYARTEPDVVDDLGFSDLSDEVSGLCLDLSHVDEAACAVTAILRDAWGVPHPSFVELRGDEPPVLVDEPEPLVAAAPNLPAVFTAASRDDLQAFVVAHLDSVQEKPLTVLADGSIPYGDSCRRAMVSVRSERRVEVWTFLATDVRRKAARREIDRLARIYTHHRFFLRGRNLVAAVALDARPLVTAQLDRALSATLALHTRESERLEEALARSPEPEPLLVELPAIDPVLLGLAGDARRMPMSDLVDLFLEVADDLLTLESWLAAARQARAEAHETMDLAASPAVKQVHRHAIRRWDAAVQALKVAASQVGREHGSAA